MKLFGERLKSAIASSSYTQKMLANELKLSDDTITNYVKGKSLPKVDTLLLICGKLSVSADWLIGSVQDTNEPNEIRNLSDKEIQVIAKLRAGSKVVFEEDVKRLTGDAGRLSDVELDLILKFRALDDRDQEDLIDSVNSKYRRSSPAKKSSTSSNGSGHADYDQGIKMA